MELRQLRYFKVVADARSFARGALNLRVAQPALSRSIAKLEDEIGHSLFVRHSSGVSLTEAGVRCYEYAAKVLESVQDLIAGMAEEDGAPKGTITLGAPQSILSKLVLPVTAAFLRKYPQCRIDVIQNSSARLRDQVAEGAIDMAILSNIAADSGMNIIPLLRERIFLICRRDERGRFGEIVDLEDLLDLPLIVVGHPDSLRLHIDRQFAHRSDALNVRSEVNSSSMVADLVAEGVGFGIAPYVPFHPENMLEYVPIRGVDTSWAIGVGWNRRGRRSIDLLQQLVVEHATELVESGKWPIASLAA